MLSWVRWALRYPLVRRLLLAAVGMFVRRRIDALRMSMFTDVGADVDVDVDDDDADDDGGSSRRWPLVALLVGAVVGWVVYRATRHEEREEFEWTPAEDTATWTPASSTEPTGDVAAAPTAPSTDDAEPTAPVADATGPEPDLDRGAAVLGQPLSTDDLKVIEGIGPKIEQVLNDGGIATWGDLSSADVDRLREILDAAGPRYRMHDPAEWPHQAALLERGEWERFAALGSRGAEADGA